MNLLAAIGQHTTSKHRLANNEKAAVGIRGGLKSDRP